MVRLIIGSVVFQPVEPFMYHNGFKSSGREMDHFLDSWMNQGQDMVDSVNSKLLKIWKEKDNVRNEEQQEHHQQQQQKHDSAKIDSSFFQSSSPGLGWAFVYEQRYHCRSHGFLSSSPTHHRKDQNRTTTAATESEPADLHLWTVYASPPLMVPVVTWHLKLVGTIPFTQDSKENGKAHSRDKPIDPAGGQLGL
jgi:hypothetical protein